jgi:copper homeostasis protein
MKIEICVDSVAGALAAEQGGADRIELCANLIEGGTTPSAGCIQLARAQIQIGLHVIIRPRGQDFLYSDLELAVMREDVLTAKRLGADGVVIGCLTAEGDVDLARTQELIGLARPMQVTFHRAFDMCRDPQSALEQLIALGVERVLTSGQEATAVEGLDMIAALNRQAGDRIIVIPGGGLTGRNVGRVVAATGVREVHLSARSTTKSRMQYRNPRCFMGGALRPPEYDWKTTDAPAVMEVVNRLRTSEPAPSEPPD